MRFCGLILALAFGGSAVYAQTVAPIRAEGGRKISGTFTLTNNTLTPLGVVVEPYSVTLYKDGKGGFIQKMHSLDPDVTLKLSETSFRASPKESHEISYKIQCPQACNVAILSGMVVGHTQSNGNNPVLAVRIILPHIIYAGCAKAKGCRQAQLDAAPIAPDAPAEASPAVAAAAVAQTNP